MKGNNRAIVLRWEKWRIGYNLILLAESLWLLWGRLAAAWSDSLFLGFTAAFAVAANGCYCLGPLIEIGVRKFCGSCIAPRCRVFLVAVRYLLFWVGLGFSMLLVYSILIHSLDYLDGYTD